MLQAGRLTTPFGGGPSLRRMASKRSGFLAALAGGIVSAIVVVALLLATGAIDTGSSGDMPVQAVAGASTEAEPSVRELFDRARGAIVRVDARPRGRPIPRGRPTRDDGGDEPADQAGDEAGALHGHGAQARPAAERRG